MILSTYFKFESIKVYIDIYILLEHNLLVVEKVCILKIKSIT